MVKIYSSGEVTVINRNQNVPELLPPIVPFQLRWFNLIIHNLQLLVLHYQFFLLKHIPLGNTSYYAKYNAWREGDNFLDWIGAEESQGTYSNQQAEGSPMVWTSNQASKLGYQPLNT